MAFSNIFFLPVAISVSVTKINKITILSRTDICILCGKHWIDNAFINPVIATKQYLTGAPFI
jgi:hypothetical protein